MKSKEILLNFKIMKTQAELIEILKKWKDNYGKLAKEYPFGSHQYNSNISHASLLALVIHEIKREE